MSAGQPRDGDQAMIDIQAPISQELDANGQALLEAAQQGDAATVRALLADGLDPNAARQPGTCYSALHLAAAGGHVSAIIALLAAGAAVDNSASAAAITPLWLALQGKHLPAAQVLLGAGASGVAEGLQASATGGSLVDMLAGAGLDVSDSALGRAIGAGDFQTLELLLQLGVAPGGVCGRALVAAAGEGELAEVQALLAAGVPADCAEYNYLSEEGIEEYEDEPRTALMAAAQGGHTDVMRCLLAAGVDVEARWWTWCGDFDQPAHHTALDVCGTAEAARMLLEAGAAVQDPDSGCFPLILQVVYGREDVVPALLEAGADPNLSPAAAAGHTALYWAAEGDLPKAVASLLAAGADPTIMSPHGSAMHRASSSEVALVLLRGGADIHASRDTDGRTPLACAAASSSYEVVEALLAAGASVQATDKEGDTALHHVIAAAHDPTYDSEGLRRMVELLCAAGADTNAVNYSGKNPLALAFSFTPLAAAINEGAMAVVGALVAAGVTPTTELLVLALRRPALRGSWLTALLPSRSISTDQLGRWAGAAFRNRRAAKQDMFWCVWALRRRLPTELLHFIAVLRCMLE